ncbi:hypothetical protein Tco_0812626 [Tanacetum coccineum]
MTIESWNDPRDFANPVKAIALPQDVSSTSDRHLIELKNQVQRLMEAHLALTQPTQVNKITTSCEICSGPHDTQYCMEDPEQAFVEYTSSRTDEAGEERNLGNTNSNPQPDPLASIATEQIIRNHDEPQNKGPNKGEGVATGEPVVEYFDTFRIRDELTYYRIKGMHFSEETSPYVINFMIVEDISSIIDHRLSQVVLGRPFVEISNMTHDPPKGDVRFIKGTNKVAYKMPHKIEQYDSFSNLEKEHTKSVYLRNHEDKKRGVEYAISKILRFYKEWLELGPKYLTGMDDDGEVT